MTITTHTAIGAAIGFSLGNPWLGFILGMLSHFAVDMIPHGDMKFAEQFKNKRRKAALAYAGIDAAVGILLLLALFNVGGYSDRATFSAAIAGSIMPDLLVSLYYATKIKWLKWFVRLHFFFHDFFLKRYGDVRLSYALTGQAAFIFLLLRQVF
jgi:membrane-bound metal-dependent hydrolase YbcI (DUF457 family)